MFKKGKKGVPGKLLVGKPKLSPRKDYRANLN